MPPRNYFRSNGSSAKFDLQPGIQRQAAKSWDEFHELARIQMAEGASPVRVSGNLPRSLPIASRSTSLAESNSLWRAEPLQRPA
jgi:hypothetical protein